MKVGRFFTRLRRAAGLPAAPCRAMEGALLAHLAGALEHYSDTLEFSYSVNGRTVAPYRYSYAFPAFGDGAAAAEIDACRALVAPFGPGASAIADRVLACAAPPAVSQILFGIDARPGAHRLKVYLQFPTGAARTKLALLARLLPPAGVRRLADAPDLLHLLGVDFDMGGVTGYKLYYLHAGVEAARIGRAFPGATLPVHLAAHRGATALDDVVLVSRLGAAGEFHGPPVAEIDLGLKANGLGWEDAAGYLARRAAGRAFDAFVRGALAGRRWAATRVSIPVKGTRKMNLYYVLLDPP